jgi:hypothetical protein
MADSSAYAEYVAQAERAVASVKDPELKRAAFEKVLDDLLASRGSARTQRSLRSSRPTKELKKKAPKKTRTGPMAYVEELYDDGFFKKPKTITQVKSELENRGHHIPLTSLSGPLQKLCQRRTLRRHRAKTSGNKVAFNYSNW